jgi:hypothetical protein
MTALVYFTGWVGLSIGMHAFPSMHDLDSFSKKVKEDRGASALYFLSVLFAGLFRIAHLLRFFWFDLFYAFTVAEIFPFLAIVFAFLVL